VSDEQHFSFLAQSLDNLTDNPIAVADTLNLPAESARAVLQDLVNRLTLEGRKVPTGSPRARAHVAWGQFVLEIDFDERDEAGRISPILCYGGLPEFDESSWQQRLQFEFEHFVADIGRRFDGGATAAISSAAQALLMTRPKQAASPKLLRRFMGPVTEQAQTLPAETVDNLIDSLLRLSHDVLYVAVRYRGEMLRRSDRQPSEPSSLAAIPGPDPRAERESVPGLLERATVGANDAGGFRFLLLGYGRYAKLVLPIRDGHASLILRSPTALRVVDPALDVLRRHQLIN
jgi:hypothetical protein